MTDPAGHIVLTDLLARPADAPAIAAGETVCLFAADGALLWGTAHGRALAARLDRPSRARVVALAADALGSWREALPLRAGSVGFSAGCAVLQGRDGRRVVLARIAGRIPRTWSATPERLTGRDPGGGDAPADALRTIAGDRPTLRFVWHTDAAGVIRSVSAALARALGGEAIVGKTWAGLAGRIDAALELDAQVRSGRAWSGLAALWRLDGGGTEIPVEFGGAPIRDAAGAPAGQRGYGLMRLDAGVTPAPEPQHQPEPAGHPVPASPLPPPADMSPAPGGDASRTDGDGLSSIVARVASGARLPEPPLPLFAPGHETVVPVPVPPPARHADIRRKSAPGGLSRGERQTLRDIAQALGAQMDETRERRVADMAGATDPRDESQNRNAGGSSAPVSAPPAAPVSPSGQEAHDVGPGGRAVADSHPPPPTAKQAADAGVRQAGAADAGLSRQPTPPEPGADIAAGQKVARDPIQDPIQDLTQDLAHELERTLERERAAIAAEARVETLRALVQATPVAALVSQEGVAVHANNAFIALSRHAGFGDVAGQRLGLLFPETALDVGFSGKGVLAGARGVRMPVELVCAPAPWTGGEALLILAMRDATAEVAARVAHLEDELAASAAREAELRGVLDTATDGVVLLDAQGRILSINRSGEALFGYEQNQLVGEPLTRLLAPESHAAARDYLESLRAGGVASLLNDGREVTGRVRQGGDCRLFMTLGKVGAGAGQRYCAVLRDVTAWKKTESELIESRRKAESANAQKSDFLARMSHEVRTPLGAMIGFAELMLEERFGPIQNPRYREYVRDIHESGQYVISLVNDLLDLARIEAGKMELSFASVDLNVVLNSCVTLMQPQASKAHIVLRGSLEEKLPPVVADERSMRQIILNVLGNALKFTDAGGQVILSSARTPSGEVVIRVRDTGIGMSEQEVVEALKPFRRLAHGRKTPGTGLGLPLTVALVEANRGALRISSTPGEGTLVEVVLPASRVLAG